MDGAPGQSGRRPVTRPIVPPVVPRTAYAVLVYAGRPRARSEWFSRDRLAGAAVHAFVIVMVVAGAAALCLAPSARSGEGCAALFLAAVSGVAVGIVLACRHVLEHRASRYALAASIIFGAAALGIFVLTLYAQEKLVALMILAGYIALADAVCAIRLFKWALWPSVLGPYHRRV